MWLWFREGWSLSYAFAGASILILSGIIPLFHTAHCGRVYAPMAACSFSCRYSRMGDGWHETGSRDTIGVSLCLIRMIIIMYVPRTYVRGLAGKMLRLIAVQESIDRATHWSNRYRS